MEIETLIDAFRGPLPGLFASWGAPWHDAHELTQDTFAEAFLSRATFRGDPGDTKKIGRWLRGIAKNRFRSWCRTQDRRASESVSEESLVAASRPQVSAAVESLRTEIDRLPEKLRSVIYMHYLEESSVAAVAGLLKVSIKAVEGRLYRARILLRDRLQDCEGELAQFRGETS